MSGTTIGFRVQGYDERHYRGIKCGMTNAGYYDSKGFGLGFRVLLLPHGEDEGHYRGTRGTRDGRPPWNIPVVQPLPLSPSTKPQVGLLLLSEITLT